MHRRWNILLLIIQFCIPVLCQSGYYAIVAPGVIKPNRKYSVFVSLLDGKAPASIRLLLGPKSSTEQMIQVVSLRPMTTKLVEFEAPNVLDGSTYQLKAEGLKGLVFEKSIEVDAMPSDWPRIYIESDKATYKPGDLLLFRVIILDEHVRPVKITEPITVQILDAQSNRLKKFRNIKLNQGVFSGAFQLSNHPMLGTWKITVEISGKYNTISDGTFEVQHHVPPNFRVNIVTTNDFVITDDILTASVYGLYTYGKNVQGTVRATLQLPDNTYLTESTDIDSKRQMAQFEFAIPYLENVAENQVVTLTADLTDRYTNQTASLEKTIRLRQQRYNILVPEADIENLNRTHYRVRVHVRNWDNSIVNDRATYVEMRLPSKTDLRVLEENGTAMFTLSKEDASDDVKFVYKDSIKDDSFPPDIHFGSAVDGVPDNCRLHVTVASRIGSRAQITIVVSADHVIPYLVYTITSHANVAHAQLIPLARNRKSYTVQVEATIEIIPEPVVFVYYVLNGHLRSCEETIVLPEKFENSISIDYQRFEDIGLRPGQEVTLNIRTQTNSHVSIMAVDSRNFLLNSYNALQKAKVMDDLRRDQTYSYSGYTHHPGTTSGLVILTNANMTTRLIEYSPEAEGRTGADNYPQGMNVRSDFPDTWIFHDIEVTDENTDLTLRVPDTITTWTVTAFSINERTGLATMMAPLEIEVSLPFFISPNLPASVKLGEVVVIPVTIYNYLRQDLLTAVAVRSPNRDFLFMNDRRRSLNIQQQAVLVNIPSNNAMTVSFMIYPRKVGDIDIEIIAKNSEANDAVRQKLRVEMNGIIKESNEELFVNMERDRESYKTSFKTEIPANVMANSEYFALSVRGDVMLPADLRHLARKPTGNGEQNMENLALNILVLDYVQVTSKFSNYTDVKEQATKNTELGYQQQLVYRQDTGAYSMYAPTSEDSQSDGTDQLPSIWLTAHAVRFFTKAEKYAFVEKKIIDSGFKYLSSQQLGEGQFASQGPVYNAPHQNQYALTSFVLLTFLENLDYASQYVNVIGKGLSFLTKNIRNINDVYSLALVANVLQKAKHNDATAVLRKLTSRAREQNGRKWWSGSDEKLPTASEVEITAYALMALLETSADPADHLPIFSWLIEQRDNGGGFKSNTNTVIGLQAIIRYVDKIDFSDNVKFQVHYEAKDIGGATLKADTMQVDSDNVRNLQTQELPSGTRSVDIDLTGYGKAFLHFVHHYAIPTYEMITGNSVSHQYYHIQPVAKMVTSTQMSLQVCFTYQPEAIDEPDTVNAIMRIQFPSGFVANSANANLPARTVANSRGTALQVYVDNIKANHEECYTFVADKRQDVHVRENSTIEMYTSNDPKHQSLASYRVL